MSEEEKAAAGAPQNPAPGGSEEIESKSNAGSAAEDMVKYETYLRKKNLADNLSAKTKELEDKIAQLENEKFEAEGNKDGIIDNLKKQVESLTGKKNEIVSNFAYASLSSQVEAEAAKLGCVDTSALIKLMDLNEFTENMDTDTFKANSDELKAAVEIQKKEKPYLFSKSGPKINTSNAKTDFTEKKEPVADMSIEDLKQKAKEIDRVEGKNLGWS